MNYEQTLSYLYSKLPMFTRVGASAFRKDLHNTLSMCEKLGNPQHKFKSIHVAGTNGKGSTSHMLAAIFQQAGYKTGLYTSPHLKDFRERIRINGVMISEDFVTAFVAQQRHTIEKLSPSFFEVTVALAFACFAEEEVDIAIIEVGLGGRLDSTNVITPVLSVITNISLDHTQMLGNTLGEIAGEKAGIIKPGIPVIIGERNQETESVFQNKARETQSEIFFADQELEIQKASMDEGFWDINLADQTGLLFEHLKLDLTGNYQLKNVITVIRAVQEMRKLGYTLEDKAIFQALSHVKQLTGLQGRWQLLDTNPLVICDTGHNEAGIREVLQNIRNTGYEHLHMVIGMVKDKDISTVLSLLPPEAAYYFCQPDLERALPSEELARQAGHQGLYGQHYTSVSEALSAAKNAASESDLIFIGGSTFVVAEVL